MALGIPARIKEDAVDLAMIEIAAKSYVESGRRFREQLRRIDG